MPTAAFAILELNVLLLIETPVIVQETAAPVMLNACTNGDPVALAIVDEIHMLL
jgi:hypothetical protein